MEGRGGQKKGRNRTKHYKGGQEANKVRKSNWDRFIHSDFKNHIIHIVICFANSFTKDNDVFSFQYGVHSNSNFAPSIEVLT